MGRTHADKKSKTAAAAEGRQPAASKRSRAPETVRYIVNESGEREAVVLPADLYDKLLERLEDLDDVRTYDEAKRERGELSSWEEVKAEVGL